MQRPRRPWWTGKAPEWVQEEEDGPAAAPPAAAPPPAAVGAPAAAPLPPGADPRLARLTQRQGQAGRRGPSEAVVVQRRRHRSPEAEDGASPPRPARGAAAADVGHRRPEAAEEPEEEGASEEEEEVEEGGGAEDDDEAIAARRMAIRARQLAAAAAPAASEEDEGDDSSEYTTDDDSEEEGGPVMLKPAFVPKTDRETLAERDAALAQAEQTTRQEAEAIEERKRQTQELVAAAQAFEVAQQEAPKEGDSGVDTDDDIDEVAQYEAWRERELSRIARDRQLRQAGNIAELKAQQPSAAMPAPLPQPKKKWNFLQKYWHKGAFFQGDDEEGVLGDVLKRDYDAPTGEDKFDKQMLPKIMQVRNFGRRGRTKWQHLLAEDTTYAAGAPDPQLPPTGRPQGRPVSQDFSKPKTHKT